MYCKKCGQKMLGVTSEVNGLCYNCSTFERTTINNLETIKEIEKEPGHYCPYCNQRFVLINDYYNHMEYFCDKKKSINFYRR